MSRCPDPNGAGQRGNRTLRTGFWSTYVGEPTVLTANDALHDYLGHHEAKPHEALG